MELVGQLHEAHGLAVALGLGHARVAGEFGFGVAALLLADDHDGLAVEEGVAADDGFVVAEGAVAVDFGEVRKDTVEVILRVGALGVAGELDARVRGAGSGSFLRNAIGVQRLDALVDIRHG